MAEIVRHLVDEEAACRCGRPGCRRGISRRAGGNPPAAGPRARRDSADGPGPVAALQLQHDALDVGQLLGALDLRMGGEDLLDQRRARARQAQDEDRIGALGSPQPARPAKNARVQTSICRLRVGLDDLGPIAAFGALQRVAALVIGPGLRRTRRDPPAPCRARSRGDSGPPARVAGDASSARMRAISVVGEAIGLEVGEAPIGVAEIGPRRRGRAVGVDRLRNVARPFSAHGRATGARPASRGASASMIAVDARSPSRARPGPPRWWRRACDSPRLPGSSASSCSTCSRAGAYFWRCTRHLRVVVARRAVVRRERQHGLEQQFRHRRTRRGRCRSAPAAAWPRDGRHA